MQLRAPPHSHSSIHISANKFLRPFGQRLSPRSCLNGVAPPSYPGLYCLRIRAVSCRIPTRRTRKVPFGFWRNLASRARAEPYGAAKREEGLLNKGILYRGLCVLLDCVRNRLFNQTWATLNHRGKARRRRRALGVVLRRHARVVRENDGFESFTTRVIADSADDGTESVFAIDINLQGKRIRMAPSASGFRVDRNTVVRDTSCLVNLPPRLTSKQPDINVR